MPENAGIANNELIKQTTSQNIKNVDRYLKQHLSHNKYKQLISKVLKDNSFEIDKKALGVLDKKASEHAKDATKKRNPNLAYDKDLAESSNYILIRFNNRYLNHIAKKHPTFKMPQMELNHMMSNTSMNRPSKFVATDTIVDNKSGQKQFISEEKAKVNRLQALQTSPDYFQNDLKASIKGTIDDYYHQKLENNMYKKILDEGMNPADQDYAVGIDGPAEQQPHLKDDYKEGLINLRTLAPATKAYINQPIGLKEKQHVEHNRDKDIKQEKYVFEHENGIPAQKIPSMNKDNFKTKLTKQLNGLQGYIQHHPWKAGVTPYEAFAKYPDAMKTLGVSDDHYYREASKAEHINKHEPILKGVYPISDPDYGGHNDAHSDNIDSEELLSTIQDMKDNMKSAHSSDLKDMESGNDDNIYATTPPNFQETNYKKAYHKQLKTKEIKKNPAQIKDIKLRHYQKAIKDNQITPDNYGEFFDKNPSVGKHVHILSGNQAKKRLKKQLHKESHWMATSNINEPLSTVKTVANMEKTDKNILSQIKVNKAYTPEQVSNIGNSPTSKVENLGKRAMEQNINAFLADDKYKQHEQQQRHQHNNFLNNHIQVQGIGFGSKEKDDHVAKDMKRDILASAGIKQPTSIKPSDIHHNLNKQHKVDIHKKSRQNHHKHTHKRGFHYGKSNPTIE